MLENGMLSSWYNDEDDYYNSDDVLGFCDDCCCNLYAYDTVYYDDSIGQFYCPECYYERKKAGEDVSSIIKGLMYEFV